MSTLGVAKAHNVTQGQGVQVCVLDSGVESTHRDFAGATFGQGADVSGAGAPDGLEATDGSSHGTSMAGFIVGQGSGPGRKQGILGVAPRATLLSVSMDLDVGAAEGIKACADLGADVISLSLGGSVDPAAVAYAQARDAVVVAGTGNLGGRDEGISPLAGQWGVLAVTGVGADLVISPGATASGPYFPVRDIDPDPTTDDLGGVGVAGPFSIKKSTMESCDGFYALAFDDRYRTMCGTSPATAIVAGVVALVRAEYPDLNAANVINRVIRTAKPPTTGSKKVPSALYGFGVVDAYAAVTAEVAEVTDNPLGSCYTGGRGIWDSRVTPTRAEPPVGVALAPAPWDAPIDDVTAAPTTTETSAAVPTPSTIPSEAPSPGAAPPSTSDEGGSGVPVAIWVAVGVALVAAVGGVLRSRRTGG